MQALSRIMYAIFLLLLSSCGIIPFVAFQLSLMHYIIQP